MPEARWYRRQTDQSVDCELCPHRCHLTEDAAGICRVRVNHQGVLYAESYGTTVSLHLDPIEKKPLFHFLPGENILSLGHNSCNLRCRFCQNAEISQVEVPTVPVTPEQPVTLCRQQGTRMVAFTYTEPLTGLEFIDETARILHEHEIKVVLVTNGYVNPGPLSEVLPHIDAMNIDLKAFTEDFYHHICGASLEPVLSTIRLAVKHCHVELTTLLVTGENDSEPEIEALTDFVAGVNPSIPLHFSRYFPQYRMTNPPTPLPTLLHAREIAQRKLSFVYIGNTTIQDVEDTLCPQCGQLLIARDRYRTQVVGLTDGHCTTCGTGIPGVWS